MENNRKEIDILELILKFYLYLRKYAWILLIALVIGIGYSVIKYKSQKPSFTSSMIIETKKENEYLYAFTLTEIQHKNLQQNPGEITVEIMKSANNLISNGNFEELSKRMGLTIDQVKSLNSVSARYNYNKDKPISEIAIVTANSSNSEAFNYLGEGIVNYVNNNSYIKSKYKTDSIFLTNVIQKLDVKLEELDNIQETFILKHSINDKYENKEYSSIAENAILTSLKENLKRELAELNKSKIIENFYLPKSVSVSLKKIIAYNVVIFLFIGIIIISFIVFNKKANIYMKSKIIN